MFNPLRYYELHEHLANEHGLVLVESQLEDIILICKKEQDFVEIPASISNGEEFYDWLHEEPKGERMKQKIEVEIDVPDGYEFEEFDKGTETDFDPAVYVFYAKFKPSKPTKKVIDLSCIVGSGIDCEFSDSDFSVLDVGKLSEIGFGGIGYIEESGCPWKYCRIRQSPHVHFWNGGDKCPLPDGLKVRLIFRIRHFIDRVIVTGQNEVEWQRVAGFEVLGVAEGWRHEWEEE